MLVIFLAAFFLAAFTTFLAARLGFAMVDFLTFLRLARILAMYAFAAALPFFSFIVCFLRYY
jgi:hypothetical protein